MSTLHRAASLLLFSTVAACASCSPEPETPRQNPLTARAAFDMNCSAEQLRYVNLGNNVWGVRGCGVRATYINRCDTGYFNGLPITEDCAWILNGAMIRDVPSPTAAPTQSPAESSQR